MSKLREHWGFGRMSYWTVIRTKANSEKRACENLKRQNFEFYFPKFKKLVGSREFVCALFPRYMFLFVVDRWRSVMSTIGVEKVLLWNDGQPCRISDEVISSLRKREENGLIKISEKEDGRFRKGQELIVTDGIFFGEKVIYQSSTSQDRELVLLSLLGRLTPMKIDTRSLSVA